MKVTSLQWLVTGRESIVADIIEVLQGQGELKPQGTIPEAGDASMGVLLTGESGIGKNHLVAEAVKELTEDVYVMHLYASANLAKEPYGALAVFLWEESPEDVSSPVQVFAAIKRRLETMARGRKVCLLVDNASELDSHSSVILAQLARIGALRLVLTCGTFNLLPRELFILVKDGYIRRLSVEPFSFLEAVTALESQLDGRLSRLAARRLWKVSGGHPLYLGSLLYDMQKSGALVCRGGVWCLDQSIVGEDRVPSELFANQLRRLSPGARRALEIVTLAGTIPINALLALVNCHDIDILQESGLIRIDLERTVTADSKLLARVVRSRVTAGRSSGLRDEVGAHMPTELHFSSAHMGMTIWSLECGRPVDAETSLASAQRANDQMQPRLALRLLDSPCPSGARTAEKVRAHVMLGQISDGHNVLKDYYASKQEEPTLDDWVGLLLAENSLLLMSQETWPEAEANLEKLRSELYPDAQKRKTLPTGTNVVALRNQLALATARSAWWIGNFSTVLDELGKCHLAAMHHGKDVLILGSQLSLALAAAGDMGRAEEIADVLWASLDQASPAPAVALQSREHLFFSYLLAGRLDTANEVARGFHDTAAEDVELQFGTTFADLALPLLAAVRGHGGECLSLLVPELAQLRIHDHQGALALALSAAAYASVQAGDCDSASRYLAELESSRATAPWLVERLGSYFELAAKGATGNYDSSVSQLMHLAKTDRENGLHHWEAMSLGLALRLGAVDVAERLLEAASQVVTGPCVFYRALAEGTLKQDAGLLALAAELAAEEGNDAAVADAAEAGLALGTLEADQERALAALLDITRRNMNISDRRAGGGQPLTARQLEIATLAAAGASNKEIAGSLHVSIRTVEGHLYQIFGKLCISDRADLPFVLDQIAGNRA